MQARNFPLPICEGMNEVMPHRKKCLRASTSHLLPGKIDLPYQRPLDISTGRTNKQQLYSSTDAATAGDGRISSQEASPSESEGRSSILQVGRRWPQERWVCVNDDVYYNDINNNKEGATNIITIVIPLRIKWGGAALVVRLRGTLEGLLRRVREAVSWVPRPG